MDFGFALMAKIDLSYSDVLITNVLIGGANIVNVNSKPLFIYVYSKFKSLEDIAWMRSFSRTWVREILATNSLDKTEQESNSDNLKVLLLVLIILIGTTVVILFSRYSNR